jgi:hypothetical protein
MRVRATDRKQRKGECQDGSQGLPCASAMNLEGSL